MNNKKKKQWEKENIISLDSLIDEDDNFISNNYFNYQEPYIEDDSKKVSLYQTIISLIYILKNKINRDYSKNFKVDSNLEIFMLRNGLVDGQIKEYDYIAKIYDISDERARQINDKIFEIATIFTKNLKTNMKIANKISIEDIMDIICSYVIENDIMIDYDDYQNNINGITKKLK